MATGNPFDLLVDDDSEDPSQLIAAQLKKTETKKTVAPSAKQAAPKSKLPSKPLPPAQAVREAKSEQARGGRGGGRGRGAGGMTYRDYGNNASSYGNREISSGHSAPVNADSGKPYERHGGYGESRGPSRGGQRGGFSNGDVEDGYREHSRRQFERHSGTGRGGDFKREGGGRGNWGTQTDELAQVAEEVVHEGEKNLNLNAEKPSPEEGAAAGGDKEAAANDIKEKEPEDKEMTLDEYEKVLEEKRKALQAPKTEERKIDVTEFESMKQLSNKKTDAEIFTKLGSEKDKKKESAEKEEKAKKSVSINEFLKPAEGERYYGGGRGRGRGRGPRGGYSGASVPVNVGSISIEDPGQFPTLGGK